MQCLRNKLRLNKQNAVATLVRLGLRNNKCPEERVNQNYLILVVLTEYGKSPFSENAS